MKQNEIDCFDINSGKIVYCKNKTKAPLNKKTLLETLENILTVEMMLMYSSNHYILENRQDKLQ